MNRQILFYYIKIYNVCDTIYLNHISVKSAFLLPSLPMEGQLRKFIRVYLSTLLSVLFWKWHGTGCWELLELRSWWGWPVRPQSSLTLLLISSWFHWGHPYYPKAHALWLLFSPCCLNTQTPSQSPQKSLCSFFLSGFCLLLPGFDWWWEISSFLLQVERWSVLYFCYSLSSFKALQPLPYPSTPRHQHD